MARKRSACAARCARNSNEKHAVTNVEDIEHVYIHVHVCEGHNSMKGTPEYAHPINPIIVIATDKLRRTLKIFPDRKKFFIFSAVLTSS